MTVFKIGLTHSWRVWSVPDPRRMLASTVEANNLTTTARLENRALLGLVWNRFEGEWPIVRANGSGSDRSEANASLSTRTGWLSQFFYSHPFLVNLNPNPSRKNVL